MLAMVYECIKYRYGQRMKLYYLNKIELYEANRYLSDIRNQTKLKQYREGYTPELIPVDNSELEKWDVVYRGRRFAETVISEEVVIFEINNNNENS